MGVDIDRVKLARILGMMGSSFDHEALAAARLADREVRRSGATWDDVLLAEPVVVYSESRRPRYEAPDPEIECRRMAAELLVNRTTLSKWEFSFTRSIVAWSGKLSMRQQDTVRTVYARIMG